MGTSDGQELELCYEMALMCKLMLGSSRLVYPPDTYAGLLHSGLATAIFRDSMSGPPFSLSIRISLASFFGNPWPFFPAVELESILTNHVAANMT